MADLNLFKPNSSRRVSVSFMTILGRGIPKPLAIRSFLVKLPITAAAADTAAARAGAGGPSRGD